MSDANLEKERIKTFEADYGMEELSLLASHFCVPLLKFCPLTGVDGTTEITADNLEAHMQADWRTFKADIFNGNMNKEHALSLKFSDYWGAVELRYSERYPFLLVLIVLVMCLPIGTAECERIFSYMNRLKDPVHNRRNNSTLRNLIMILCNGPQTIEAFDHDIDRFIDHWESEFERRPNFS